MKFEKYINELQENGFSVIGNIYTDQEINEMASCLEHANQHSNSFMKTKDLFAIRQLIVHIPSLKKPLFNSKMMELISTFSESDYFLTKAIYFDKPSASNWFVAYHQDLSISVKEKVDLNQFKNWTYKKGQYGVQPPLEILEDTITVRIHLDKTDTGNGALRVIPKSHLHGIIRSDSNDWNRESEIVCDVEKGGAMLMKPLTLHASKRTTNRKQRRVIHLEFNKHLLPKPLQWLEYFNPKD